jgi:hypothetical protein
MTTLGFKLGPSMTCATEQRLHDDPQQAPRAKPSVRCDIHLPGSSRSNNGVPEPRSHSLNGVPPAKTENA